MARYVRHISCGTQEEWEQCRNSAPFKGMVNVIPATLYVNGDSVAVVTTKEWVKWLTNQTDIVPTGDCT